MIAQAQSINVSQRNIDYRDQWENLKLARIFLMMATIGFFISLFTSGSVASEFAETPWSKFGWVVIACVISCCSLTFLTAAYKQFKNRSIVAGLLIFCIWTACFTIDCIMVSGFAASTLKTVLINSSEYKENKITLAQARETVKLLDHNSHYNSVALENNIGTHKEDLQIEKDLYQDCLNTRCKKNGKKNMKAIEIKIQSDREKLAGAYEYMSAVKQLNSLTSIKLTDLSLPVFQNLSSVFGGTSAEREQFIMGALSILITVISITCFFLVENLKSKVNPALFPEVDNSILKDLSIIYSAIVSFLTGTAPKIQNYHQRIINLNPHLIPEDVPDYDQKSAGTQPTSYSPAPALSVKKNDQMIVPVCDVSYENNPFTNQGRSVPCPQRGTRGQGEAQQECGGDTGTVEDLDTEGQGCTAKVFEGSTVGYQEVEDAVKSGKIDKITIRSLKKFCGCGEGKANTIIDHLFSNDLIDANRNIIV